MPSSFFSSTQYCKFEKTKPVQLIDGLKITSFQPGNVVNDAVLVKSIKGKKKLHIALATNHSMLLFNGEIVIKQIQEAADKIACYDNYVVGVSQTTCILWNIVEDTTRKFEMSITDDIHSIAVLDDKLYVGTTQILVFSLQNLELIASSSTSDIYIDQIICHHNLVICMSKESNALTIFKLKKDKRKGKKLMQVDTICVNYSISNACIFNDYLTVTTLKDFSVFEVKEEVFDLKATSIVNQDLEVALCDLDENGNLNAHLFIHPYSSYFKIDYSNFPKSIEIDSSSMQSNVGHPKVAIVDQNEPTLGDLIPQVEPQDEEEIVLTTTSASLTPLLLQAIKGQDQSLFQSCLNAPVHSIRKSIKKLPPQAVTGLVHLLRQRLEKQLTGPTMLWMSELLIRHGSLIKSGPAAKDIYAIEHYLNEKTSIYDKIIEVTAQLEMSLALQEDVVLISDDMEE